MARNIVKDYIEYDKSFLKNYINTITEKQINNKMCDMIVDTYVNVRYYDTYEHIKKYPIDNIEYYAVENLKKTFDDKSMKNNIPLIVSALIIIRYVLLIEKYFKNKNASKELEQYENKLKEKYDNTKVVVSNLIKEIKDNYHKKEKFLNKLLSNDFCVVKRETNLDNVHDLFFDNSVKIPDLFSDIAISRVYNSGIIYEDRMIVFYLLTTREILVDMINYDYEKKYLLDFPKVLLDKRNKLSNLLKLIDTDYLKERMILKVLCTEYLDKKDDYDNLIHEGYSLAIEMNGVIKDSTIFLNVFTYIIVNNENDKKLLEKDFNNIILI